jgi:hypothetical protein
VVRIILEVYITHQRALFLEFGTWETGFNVQATKHNKKLMHVFDLEFCNFMLFNCLVSEKTIRG